jgi:hypothetical protein
LHDRRALSNTCGDHPVLIARPVRVILWGRGTRSPLRSDKARLGCGRRTAGRKCGTAQSRGAVWPCATERTRRSSSAAITRASAVAGSGRDSGPSRMARARRA